MKMLAVSVLVAMMALTRGASLSDSEAAPTTEPIKEENMCDLLKEIGAMTEKQRVMETRLKDSETRLKDAETRLKDSETRLKDSENQILELKSKERTMIVFSGAISGSGHIGPFDTDKTLVYRTVKTNIGNAYSQSTGIFTAPVPGIYYFTFFYNAGGSQRVSLTLMKNNEAVVKTADNSTSYDEADNGGNAVFLQLQQGDQVYMHLLANTHVWGDNLATTFSAFLVRQV